MQNEPSTNGRHLGDYVGLLRRQWVVLVVALVVGVVAGVGLLTVLPKSYTATSSVLVKAITEPGEAVDARTVGEINMDTESQVVKSLPVASEVKDATGSALTPVALSSKVSVSIPANTTIISIEFEADSAAEARDGAQAFAQGYLDYRSSAAQDRVDQQLRQLDRESADTEERIRVLLRKLPSLESGSAEQLSTAQELRRLRSRSNWVDEQRLPLQTAQTAPGSVIADAQTPSHPTSPNRVLVMGSTVGLAMLLGLAIAWWRDRHLGRIRSAHEVEVDLDLEVLGSVRQTRLREAVGGRGPAGRPLQEYRQLVHAIQARVSDDEHDVLVAGVGLASTAQEVAHSLATAVSRTGTDVVLVFSEQSTVETFARDDLVGASERAHEAYLERTSLEAARLVIDGDVQNRALPGYLESLHGDDGQLVILSTPPMESSADAQAVAPYVKLSILVVEANRTTQQDVASALRQLHQVGVESVCAIVVTGRRRRRDSLRVVSDVSTSDVDTADDGGDHGDSGLKKKGTKTKKAKRTGVEDEPAEDIDATERSVGVRGST